MNLIWSYLLYRHECFTGKYTTRKIHKNYIRDPSGLFSIISHVRLSMISLISSLSLKLYLSSLVYHRNIFGSSSKVFGNVRNAEVTGSNPVEALIFFFFRLLLSNCLNWKIHCDDHSSLSSTTAVQIRIISYTWHHFFLSSTVMLGIIVSLGATLNLWPGHSHHSTPSIGRIFEIAFLQELPECFHLFLCK